MQVKILAVDRSAYDGEARAVSALAADGALVVLPGHEPLITALVPGALVVTDESGTDHRYALGGGVMTIDADRITILADMAEDGSALDAAAIRERRAKLSEEITAIRGSDKSEDIERLVAMEEEYVRESARLQASV